MVATQPNASHGHVPPLKRLAQIAAWLAGLLLAAVVAWHMPFMDWPRTLWELVRMPVPVASPVPVAGVAARDIEATFGAPRSGDRIHDGIDIFATRGTPVLSATRGVVMSVRDSGFGGKQVWVIGPARERHYYAHLDAWAEGLERGDVLEPGTPLGQVGDTGNARGLPPHLHYGIYGEGGALDPLPRLLAGASGPDLAPVSTHEPTR